MNDVASPAGGEWPAVLAALLDDAGMAGRAVAEVAPMTGGVSSDIVRIRLDDGREFCAKRALAKLNVAADWRVPVERNRYEIAWLRLAGRVVPGAVPEVFAENRAAGAVLLSYLPPSEHTLWKSDLLAGTCDPEVARVLGGVIGCIHRATLADAAVAQAFATDALFDALRLDPYLRTTAARHPAVAAEITAVVEATRTSRIALVHGDLSPKNILVRRADHRPVILDAECAWYGDPAFDGAFLINHLALKAIHRPADAAVLIAMARDFADRWLAHFPEDVRTAVAGRTARLLPCLMLARIDGKSPVEYLSEGARQTTRTLAVRLISAGPAALAQVLGAVAEAGAAA
jgi:tRNA A-37 threonylcarbamoyl transferase component Bud32